MTGKSGKIFMWVAGAVMCAGLMAAGRAGTLPVSAAETCGAFLVEGDSGGFSYDSNVLTISEGGAYTISMSESNEEGTTDDTVKVTSSEDVVLTLDGVIVENSENPPLEINASGNVTLVLKGENSFITRSNSLAAVQKTSTANTLTITSASGDGSEEGSLTAKVGSWGAGIGGKYNGGDGNNITINGGTITATGVEGAGIGGAFRGSGYDITINGGTVIASSSIGAGIGGGHAKGNGYDITINGGTVIASSSSGAGIGGGQWGSGKNIKIYGGYVKATTNDSSAYALGRPRKGSGDSGGYVCIETQKMEARTSADGEYTVYTAGENFVSVGTYFECQEVTEELGDFVVKGTGTYSYENGVLSVTGGGKCAISLKDGVESTADVIRIASDEDIDLTLDNLLINAVSGSPLTATGAGKVTLCLKGENTFASKDGSPVLKREDGAGSIVVSTAYGTPGVYYDEEKTSRFVYADGCDISEDMEGSSYFYSEIVTEIKKGDVLQMADTSPVYVKEDADGRTTVTDENGTEIFGGDLSGAELRTSAQKIIVQGGAVGTIEGNEEIIVQGGAVDTIKGNGEDTLVYVSGSPVCGIDLSTVKEGCVIVGDGSSSGLDESAKITLINCKEGDVAKAYPGDPETELESFADNFTLSAEDLVLNYNADKNTIVAEKAAEKQEEKTEESTEKQNPTKPSEEESSTEKKNSVEPSEEESSAEKRDDSTQSSQVTTICLKLQPYTHKNKLTWKKVKGADGYIIYRTKCGNSTAKMKKIKTIRSGSKLKWQNTKLKKNTWYKYRIDAYRIVNGKRVVIGRSLVVHTLTGGGKKYGNPVKVTVKKKKFTVKKGGSARIRAKVVLPKGRKAKWHVAKIRYVVSDKNILTVSSSGKIKAKKKGTCTVWAVAQNGVQCKVEVKVK